MSAISEQDPHRRKTSTSCEARSGPFGSELRSRGIHRSIPATGSTAEPGKVITKVERQRRLDEHKNKSKSPSPEALASSTATFSETGEKILAWLARFLIGSREDDPGLLHQANRELDDSLVPEAVAPALYYPGGGPGRQQVLLRSFIIFVILFLLFITPLYIVVEYLIDGTRAEAACTTTTIYVPVTQISTITSTFSAPPSGASDSSTAITTTSYSTIHSTSTFYSTVTVTTVPPGYPTASYVMTVTQTQTVSPLSTPPSIVSTIGSAAASTPTVTAPPYTTTSFSFVGPPITITSTSTFYSTVQVSYAPSSRPSYGGYGPSGWNVSSVDTVGPTAGSAAPTSASEFVSTITATYYLGNGSSTTQTGTTHITTTVTVHGTSTVTLSSLSTSFSYPPSSSTTSSSSTVSESTSVVSSSSSSATAAPGSSSVTLAPASTSIVYSNTSTSVSTNMPTLSTMSSYGIGTAPLPAPSSMESSATFANLTSTFTSSSAVSSSLSSLSSGDTSTTQAASRSSTTKAVIVPITTTLSFGSLTTFLKSTSTTIGLLGTSTQTVSSYFVWNGTTTNVNGPTATSSSFTSTLDSSTTSLPLSASTTSTSISSGPSALSSSSTTAGPITTSSAPPSISIPVYGSTAALSALSSELSGLTTSTLSSETTSSTSAVSTSIESSSAGSTLSSTSSTLMTTTSSAISTTSVSNSISSGLPSTVSTMASSSSGSSSSSTDQSSAASAQSISSSAISTTTSTTSTSPSPSSTSTMSTAQSTLQGYSQPPAVSSTARQSSASNAFPASSATATPTACGESGPFTMTFDDLPSFTPNNLNQTDITQAPPVPNPYHHLTFSNGYVYAPQPNEPYLPASLPHLAMFLANGSGMRTGPRAGSANPGEIADGPYQSMSAFWFNAFSAFVGCDNSGPSDCTLVLTGYTWSQDAGHEIATYTQNATVAPCPSLQGCTMQSITFPESFRTLSGLQMRAFVGQEERMFFVDNLALAWSDDTCAAGMERLRHQ